MSLEFCIKMCVFARLTNATSSKSLPYVTIICGAENSTAIVAIMVNRVKIIKQSLSTTMAANFQSFVTSAASSSFLYFSVITRISLRMSESSRWDPIQLCTICGSSCPPPPDTLRKPVVLEDCNVPVWRKSSSISNTLARRLLEDRSFSSSSLSCSVLRGSGSPLGLLILKIHGIHCRNISLTYGTKQQYQSTSLVQVANIERQHKLSEHKFMTQITN
jgi:hypothetical protein